MFRFEHPELIWISVVVILLIAAYYFRRYLSFRDWSKWGTEPSNQKVLSTLKTKPRLLWLGLLSAVLLSVATINPQWGFRSVTVETKSAAIYLLLDISNSMLAEDVAPSRLERARRLALDISTAFRTDQVGLILFAGNAYMQSPLTTDWNAIQLYLNAAHPDQAGTQGTAIGEGIRLALKTNNEEGDFDAGALIILTDGEDHDSDALAAMDEAAAAGWITYIIGVGTETGATIPMSIDGRKDFKRDENGQPVKTALNRSLMIDLARHGNGKYFDLAEGATLTENLKKELAGLERTRQEKRSFSEHKSYFQWFLLPAILLLFLGSFYNYRHDVL
jgi:Ca-activated chloride channel homolog